MKPYPILIRGVLYPSQCAAARALGVSHRTVYSALERGSLDFVGCGRNYHNKKRTTIEGVTYPTMKAAAHAQGWPEHIITTAKRKALTKPFTLRGKLILIEE